MELSAGLRGVIKSQVRAMDCASALSLSPDEQFPNVMATARMVALMEQASAKILAPFLKLGELSVGVDVNIKHISPTPVSDIVRAEAIFIGMDGKLYKFEVKAYDSGGEIGFGTHTRAIVDDKRLVAKALSKLK
ncbi:thioesterase family protein [Pseudaquidulcibacter saccharophilus]|uniref:thioesterase family protein n=1 Tax=Pseudaquidulcibacter saccharophilus TaxID=2831900 RepID=UPI001EFEFCF5|nr:thioesterase family protein [Pseudaquidulcibacter saccharophilus]